MGNINYSLWALRQLYSISKVRILHEFIIKFVFYFEWIFYSGFFVRMMTVFYEEGYDFSVVVEFIVGVIIVFVIIATYRSYYENVMVPLTNIQIQKDMEALLYSKAAEVELKCYEDEKFYNKYLIALNNASKALIDNVTNIASIFMGAFAAVIVTFMLFSLEPTVILFTIFPIIGNFVFGKMLSSIEVERYKEQIQLDRKLNYIDRVMYLKQYAKEMRLYNIFEVFKCMYKETIDRKTGVVKKFARKSVIAFCLFQFFTFTFMFDTLLLFGAYVTLVNKTMSLSQLSVLTSLMVTTSWIYIGFADAFLGYKKNNIILEAVNCFINYQPLMSTKKKMLTVPEKFENIEFRNVSFSYNGKKIINNFNFKFKSNQKIAIVGLNGAGKTTLIKLLLRLYDVDSGEILLNGINIKTYNIEEYRNMFAVAFQEQNIFSLSILDNICIDKDKDCKRVICSLEKVKLYEKIKSFKNGIKSILTKEFDEEGVELSGGEVQKLNLARVLHSNSKIKIYDEPTSALDPIAEKELFECIYENESDLQIFISHRLSATKIADIILLIKDGYVIEKGSHNELMLQNGEYADLYKKQAKNYLVNNCK